MISDTVRHVKASGYRRTEVHRLAIWFVVGFVTAVALQAIQIRTIGGGIDGLLSVGESSVARPRIEADLGPVAVTSGNGHDGQASYLIARDPLGTDGSADLLDHGGYRYRRILLPAAAGGFGLLGPNATLAGLALWTALGMGLATAALADVAALLGARAWVVFGVLANPGVWLSVQLLTPDSLALGLAMVGVALWLRNRNAWAVAALALAALTKEPYILFALGLAAWSWSRGRKAQAVTGALGAGLPLAVWSLYLSLTLGQGFAPRGNLTWPMTGVTDAASLWFSAGTSDLVLAFLTVFTLIAVLIAPIVAKSRLIMWLAWPWAAIAITSSTWVWEWGNNSIRAFAPLGMLALLGLALAVSAFYESEDAPDKRRWMSEVRRA